MVLRSSRVLSYLDTSFLATIPGKYTLEVIHNNTTYKKHNTLFISNKTEIKENLKIAIVGEGPSGLLCILCLLKYKIDNDLDFEISWYKKRNNYTRRHIVNISKDLVKKINNILQDCDECIKVNNNNKLLLSISCFEKLLFSFIILFLKL